MILILFFNLNEYSIKDYIYKKIVARKRQILAGKIYKLVS